MLARAYVCIPGESAWNGVVWDDMVWYGWCTMTTENQTWREKKTKKNLSCNVLYLYKTGTANLGLEIGNWTGTGNWITLDFGLVQTSTDLHHATGALQQRGSKSGMSGMSGMSWRPGTRMNEWMAWNERKSLEFWFGLVRFGLIWFSFTCTITQIPQKKTPREFRAVTHPCT